MKEPDQTIRSEVFLAVIGITPAVLSECLYYYYHPHYGQQRHFDEIKVLTTSRGRDLLVEKLLKGGILADLEADLDLETGSLPFGEADIIVFEDEDGGGDIQDLLTSADNEAAAQVVTRWVKYYTDQDHVRLTATVAGGRKTQSALMALAFQLYGRNRDDLIHIIVPDAIMQDRSWFYPNDPADPEQLLSVSDVPVLRVGRYLSRNLDRSPDELIREIQESLIAAAPIQELVVSRNIFTVNGETMRLSPREASYYRYFLKVRQEAGCAPDCPGCSECCVNRDRILEDSRTVILEEHAVASGEDGHFERTREKRLNTADYLLIPSLYEEISRLISAVRRAELHPLRREELVPRKVCLTPGNRKEVSIGVAVDPACIRFQD